MAGVPAVDTVVWWVRASYCGSTVWCWAQGFFCGKVFAADTVGRWVLAKLGNVSELIAVSALVVVSRVVVIN